MSFFLFIVEDLKGDDLKIRFYIGFVNFGIFMVIFNSLLLIIGKLNYWLEWKGFIKGKGIFGK